MKQIQGERPFVEGWYLCVDVDGQTLYCSPTLFTEESKADKWRQRYEKNFRPSPSGKRRTVYLKPKETEMKR